MEEEGRFVAFVINCISPDREIHVPWIFLPLFVASREIDEPRATLFSFRPGVNGGRSTSGEKRKERKNKTALCLPRFYLAYKFAHCCFYSKSSGREGGGRGGGTDCQLVARACDASFLFNRGSFYLLLQCGRACTVRHNITGQTIDERRAEDRAEKERGREKEGRREIKRVGAAFMRCHIHQGN